MNTLRFILLLSNIAMAGLGGLLIYYLYLHSNILTTECFWFICAAITFNAILGVYGIIIAVKKSKRSNLIWAYALIVLLSLCFQVLGKLYITTPEAYDSTEMIKNAVEKAWENYKEDRESMDMKHIEITHNCCGLNSTRDYSKLGIATPAHCYQENDKEKGPCLTSIQSHSNSEFDKFKNSEYGSITVNALCFILALFLACTYSENQYVKFIMSICIDDDEIDFT